MTRDETLLQMLERIEDDLHELVRLARRQDELLEILVRQGR